MKLMRNFLLLSDRTKLMNALLLPLLDYADVTFSDATGVQLNRMERLQNICTHFIHGFLKYDQCIYITSWLKFRERRNINILSLLFKIFTLLP